MLDCGSKSTACEAGQKLIAVVAEDMEGARSRIKGTRGYRLAYAKSYYRPAGVCLDVGSISPGAVAVHGYWCSHLKRLRDVLGLNVVSDSFGLSDRGRWIIGRRLSSTKGPEWSRLVYRLFANGLR